jgi:hypothetical protein
MAQLILGMNPEGKTEAINISDEGFLIAAQQAGWNVTTVTIASSETASTELDFSSYKFLAILMPSAWTSATLTIYGSATAGGTKRVIKNDSGQTFPAMTVAVDEIYTIDTNALMIAALPYLSFVASAAQGAARTITVMMKG